jgi:hypothetical protein
MRAAQVKQPAIADEEQNKDSPDQVMNVPATHHDPVEWSLAVYDEGNEQTDAQEGHEKCNRSEKNAASWTVRDRCADQVSEPCELQDHKENSRYQ